MVYPQSKLTRPLRRGIMIFLIACFFIISPIIILYTAGYRYDFQAHSLKQTGVISIDAKPDDAQVFLNLVQIKKSIPIRLANRALGTYTVTIKKPGYKEWQKDITVENNQTTYIKNVTLFKQALPVPILENDKINASSMRASEDGSYILLASQQNGIYDVILFDTNTRKNLPILRTKTKTEPEISWSPFNNFALIKTEDAGKQSWQIFSAINLELSKTYTFHSQRIDFQWSRNQLSPALYIKEKNDIKFIDMNGERKLSATTSSVWHVDEEENIWTFDANKNTLNKLSKKQELLAEYALKEKIEKILNTNKKRLLLQIKDNLLVISLDADAKIAGLQTLPTQSAYFNEKTKEWLAWSEWELWSVYEDGRMFLLNRTGEKISFVAPLDQYGLILLASENKITGFNPGYYVTQELFSGGKIEQIGVNVKQRKIYFLGTVGQKKGVFELEY